MAATGFTPLQLYYSLTASNVPVNTNLVSGELALNVVDGKLYYKDNTNTVRLLASTATSTGLGTMATQNANAVAITGGSITGVTGVPPPGTIIMFAGATAPTGYLACPLVPTAISRTAYAALFAAIGTVWGAGDGSTTFGMPYFPAGLTGVQANPATTALATALVAGNTYTIATVGTTNWTLLGASANTVGRPFVALPTNSVVATAIVTGYTYTILTLGSTNWTLVGAASNTVGVTFVANATAGLGTGTAQTVQGFGTGTVFSQGVGNATIGQVISHVHSSVTSYARLSINNVYAYFVGTGGEGTTTSKSTDATGGTNNLAAGGYILHCVKI